MESSKIYSRKITTHLQKYKGPEQDQQIEEQYQLGWTMFLQGNVTKQFKRIFVPYLIKENCKKSFITNFSVEKGMDRQTKQG
jgi:hypothetical protein